MYGLIIDFWSKAKSPMIWLGCRNLGAFSAPWSRIVRTSDIWIISEKYSCADAAALMSHAPLLGSGSREQDLGVVREAP